MTPVMLEVEMVLVTPRKNVLNSEAPMTEVVLKDTECVAPVIDHYKMYSNVFFKILSFLVIGRCGDTISQNNTYFESRGSESGSCTLKICKCSTNVCQLRLDFDTFQISGPSTSTQSVTQVLAGQTNTDGAAASNAGRCLTDQFSVTAPTASNTPPTICGTNTGEHSKTKLR